MFLLTTGNTVDTEAGELREELSDDAFSLARGWKAYSNDVTFRWIVSPSKRAALKLTSGSASAGPLPCSRRLGIDSALWRR